jgi:hypothetical protein
VKVFPLPPDWPQLNAQERIWNDTRKHVTHNRFFERPRELCEALFRRFDYVRQNPEEIAGLLRPFSKLNVELFMRGYIVLVFGLLVRRFWVARWTHSRLSAPSVLSRWASKTNVICRARCPVSEADETMLRDSGGTHPSRCRSVREF